MTNAKYLIILWSITAVISICFFRFGLSDWLNFLCSVTEYAGRTSECVRCSEFIRHFDGFVYSWNGTRVDVPPEVIMSVSQ